MLGSTHAQFYMAMISNQTLFVEKTVQEVIWGYNDSIFSMMELLELVRSPVMSAEVCKITCTKFLYVNCNPISLVKYEYSSILYSTYWYVIYNITALLRLQPHCVGKKDINLLNGLVQWRNLTEIVEWDSKDARHIYGNLGELFHPRINKHDTLTLFLEELFRYIFS